MGHVTGIGGVFFRADDPKALYAWYERHLGMHSAEDGSGVAFDWATPEEVGRQGSTVWALFPRDTTYFGRAESQLMVNYRVTDLDGLLEQLQRDGVQIDPHQEEYPYGRFAWITDPEGNRIELWEPPTS